MNNRQNKERRFWNRFATIYDSFINKIFRKTYSSIIENLDSELNSAYNVLDIGTGTGIIPFYIYSKVSSVVATDISPEMIRVANEKQKKSNIRNIDFQVQDSYSLNFPDKSFDVVIASNLLHILYEPDKPINEVKRVMKDNGIFIAPTLCVGENTRSRIIAGITGALSGFKVVNKWSFNEFKNMLTNSGFSINKITLIAGRFPLAYIVMKKSSTLMMSILLMSFIFINSCSDASNKNDYLRKVLTNLEQIKSATYYSTLYAYSPWDTLAYGIQHRYYKEYINQSDTSVGASFVSLLQSDTTKMEYCYDGTIRAWVIRDEKTFVVDDFKNNPWPYRVVMAPFLTRARSIIQYALETKDSILIDTKEYGDSVLFSFTIYNQVVEFVGKHPVYEILAGSMAGETSRYDIWVNKSTDLPYRIIRDMPHNKSDEVISNVRLNEIRIEDFIASDYFPTDYTLQTQNNKKTSEYELLGKSAPDWTLSDTNGKTIALAKIKSKVFMIQFTSINCGPCKQSIPFLKKLSSEYENIDFDFVIIESTSRNSIVLKKYQEKNDFSYNFLMSTDSVIKSYNIKAYPIFLILDSKRVIRKVFEGYGKEKTDKKIRDAINELL